MCYDKCCAFMQAAQLIAAQSPGHLPQVPQQWCSITTGGCQQALQDACSQPWCAMQELGLPEKPDAPMLGFIGRLDYQKGVDLIRDNFWWIMDEGCQLVLLGTGRDDLENSLRCARAAPGRPLQMLYLVEHRCSAAERRLHSTC